MIKPVDLKMSFLYPLMEERFGNRISKISFPLELLNRLAQRWKKSSIAEAKASLSYIQKIYHGKLPFCAFEYVGSL